MDAEHLSREIIEKTTTDTVERDIGVLTWTLVEGVLEEYGSPFWQQGKAKTLIEIFTKHHVTPWIGLAMMKAEASFGNTKNNPDVDERNIANPFGLHFNQDKRFDHLRRNWLLIPDPNGEYESTVSSSASVKGFRLPTFEEAASAAATTLEHRTLSKYNERGAHYKLEIDGHLRDILRRTFNNRRVHDELEHVFEARRR